MQKEENSKKIISWRDSGAAGGAMIGLRQSSDPGHGALIIFYPP